MIRFYDISLNEEMIMCNVPYECDSGHTSSPYPEDCTEIVDVKYCDPLILVRCKTANGNWEGERLILGRAYTVKYKCNQADNYHSVTVPCGMETDLISVPELHEKLRDMSKVGPHMEACIVHDYMYGAQYDIEGPCPYTSKDCKRNRDRLFTDNLFLHLLKKAGVIRYHRRNIYNKVRSYGDNEFNTSKNKFWGNRCFCNDPHNICNNI